MRIILSGIDLQFESAAHAAELLVNLIDHARPHPAVEVLERVIARTLPKPRPAPQRQLSATSSAVIAAARAAAPIAKAKPTESDDRQRAKVDARRDAILELMKTGPVTFGELLRKLPAVHSTGMDADQKVRAVQNSLQVMKAKGLIGRAGQNWVRR